MTARKIKGDLNQIRSTLWALGEDGRLYVKFNHEWAIAYPNIEIKEEPEWQGAE